VTSGEVREELVQRTLPGLQLGKNKTSGLSVYRETTDSRQKLELLKEMMIEVDHES
jgi:hypothetical protein